MNERNGCTIEGTRQREGASSFFIIPTDDSDHPYEFLIGWQGDEHRHIQRAASSFSAGHTTSGPRTFRYLDAPVSILGRNDGPLQLKHNITEKHGRFSLHSRLVQHHAGPIELRDWVNGNDLFFVNCTRRTARIDGFLAMKRIRQTRGGGANQPEFISVCVPSTKYNNERNIFMLFQLTSPRSTSHAVSEEDIKSPEEVELNEEFDAYVGSRDFSPSKGSGSQLKLREVPLPRKDGAGVGLEMKEMPPVATFEQ